MALIIDATREQIAVAQDRIRAKLFLSAARQVVLQYNADKADDTLPAFYHIDYAFDGDSPLGRAEITSAGKFRHPNCTPVCDLKIDDEAGAIPAIDLQADDLALEDFPSSTTDSLHVDIPDAAVIALIDEARSRRASALAQIAAERDRFATGAHGGATGVKMRAYGNGNRLISVSATHEDRTDGDGIYIERDLFATLDDADIEFIADELMSQTIYASSFEKESV